MLDEAARKRRRFVFNVLNVREFAADLDFWRYIII